MVFTIHRDRSEKGIYLSELNSMNVLEQWKIDVIEYGSMTQGYVMMYAVVRVSSSETERLVRVKATGLSNLLLLPIDGE